MAVIEFICLHCKETLEASDDEAGCPVKCPACERQLHVPVSPPAQIQKKNVSDSDKHRSKMINKPSPKPPPAPVKKGIQGTLKDLCPTFWKLASEAVSSPDAPDTRASQAWLEGYKAFEKGKVYFRSKQYQEALACFDKAIEFGFPGDGRANADGEVYGLRGSCLTIDFPLDAIDDFTKAISLHPEDCNLWFQRSNAKGATGDIEGAISDLQEAIRRSEVDTELNRSYRIGAEDMGWPEGHTALYKGQLPFLQLDVSASEAIKQLRKSMYKTRRRNVTTNSDG